MHKLMKLTKCSISWQGTIIIITIYFHMHV